MDLKDVLKVRHEKLAEYHKKEQENRVQRANFARRNLTKNIMEKIRKVALSDMKIESIYIEIEELMDMARPNSLYRFVFWKKNMYWNYNETLEAVNDVIHQVTQSIADRGVEITKYSNCSKIVKIKINL